MKKIFKIILIIFLVIVALVGFLAFRLLCDLKTREEQQQLMIKTDEELIGEHLYIKRNNKNDVDVNIYIPETNDKLPLVINIHGGAFIAGDADTLDTQSDRISKNWNVNVATVNYSLLADGITKEYATEEIKDTIKYFIDNEEKYNVDVNNIYVMGYSAGGYYAMASTLQLYKDGINIKGQILCYAFISDILEQYNGLENNVKTSFPKSLFILAGDEPIGNGSLDYEKVLKENGNDTEVKVYNGVLHGFIEENNPEYEKLNKNNKNSKSAEAEIIAREAEDYIKEWINKNK